MNTSIARDPGPRQAHNPCSAGRFRAPGHPGGAGLTARSGLGHLLVSGPVARPTEGWLAEELSGLGYLEPGGALGDEAIALQQLVEDVRGSIKIRQLVLLAHRECFGVKDHLKDRGLLS